MSTVIVQDIDCRERSLPIRNQQVNWNCIIARQANLQLTSLIPITLFLGQHPHIIASSRGRRRRQHTIHHLLSGCFSPCIKILNITIAPSQRISQILYQGVCINRQITLELIFFTLLGKCESGSQQTSSYHTSLFYHLFFHIFSLLRLQRYELLSEPYP